MCLSFYVFVYTPVIIDQTFVIFQSPYKIKIHYYKTWEKQSKLMTIKDKMPKDFLQINFW